jgi:YidC/Oxa1 family membrane protein insertase
MKQLFIFVIIALLYYKGFSFESTQSKDTSISFLKTPSLYLKWGDEKGVPLVWKVQNKKNKGEKEWYSIITGLESEDVIFQHLCIRGALGGKNIYFIANNASQTVIDQSVSNKVVNSYSFDNNGLELNQVFEESAYPYHFNMSVILSNNAAENFSVLPHDSLVLILGPGLGQRKSGQQEIPRSMYYYVEPVASLNGNVYRHIAGTLKADILPWISGELQWAGLHNRYFALLILPNKLKDANVSLPFPKIYINFNSSSSKKKQPAHDLPVLSFQLPVLSLEPGENVQWNFTIFSGPKSYDALRAGPENLNSLLFSDLWSWMRWICLGLYRLLSVIHFFIPNWGWSIIMLALIVRIVLYPVAQKAQKSQNRFIEAQKQMLPELSEIKKNYKGGERSEQILQLYKKHKVSPFAGLKPLLVVLIQLPILIALFHVLGTAFELRDTSFLWIKTLSEPDQLFSFGVNIPFLGEYFNLLPFLMAVVTLITFKLSPAPTAEKKNQRLQNIFLLVMTLMFFFLFYNFPAGMVLYWTFANVFHIVQQRLMKRASVRL